MEQDKQRPNGKWTTITLAILSSANASTGAYILALLLVSVYPLAYALLPPFKPNSAVKAFKETAKATITYHKEHESLLGGSANIARVDGLRKEAMTLKLMHVQAHQGLSLTRVSSWVRYANDGWNIWVKARGYQREIDALKGELKILVLQAKEARVQVGSGARNGQGRDETSSASSSERVDAIV